MTFTQLEYVISCERHGSFTGAAKEMFTSTSNISKAVYSLEKEIGYQIFDRTTQGLIITEKGKRFVKHVQKILEELNMINNLELEIPFYKLNIASVPNSFSFDAFSKLVSQYEDEDWIELRFDTVCTDIPNSLLKGKNDLGILVSPKDNYDIAQFLKRGLVVKIIYKIEINLNFNKNHPLVEAYEKTGILDYSKLADYPLIDYLNDTFFLNYAFQVCKELKVINKSKSIRVGDRHWKFQLVNNTNGFSIGTKLSKKAQDYFNIASIPIPNAYADVLLLYPNNQSLSILAEDYVSLLIKEFEQIE